MQWLERWVAFITAHPFVTMGVGLGAAAIALHLDGVIWSLSGNPRVLPIIGAMNAMGGIGSLVFACFAGHAAWFRWRHAALIAAGRQAPLPDAPWDPRPPAAPVGPTYLRSVGWSAMGFGIAVPFLLSLTPLAGFGDAIVAACAVVVLTTFLASRRLTLKAAPVASGP